jgi:hypothetical protein
VIFEYSHFFRGCGSHAEGKITFVHQRCGCELKVKIQNRSKPHIYFKVQIPHDMMYMYSALSIHSKTLVKKGGSPLFPTKMAITQPPLFLENAPPESFYLSTCTQITPNALKMHLESKKPQQNFFT